MWHSATFAHMQIPKRHLLIVLLAIAASAAIFWFYTQKPKTWSATEEEKPDIAVITGLETCEVCGYQAVAPGTDSCQNCQVVVNAERVKNSGLTQEAFLQMEQLHYFSSDTVNFEVDLYGPPVTQDGYPKDTLWKPQPQVNKGTVTEMLRIRVTELKK